MVLPYSCRFPVRNTLVKEIKAGNFASWLGLTYQNSAKFCPITDDTLKGHIVQERQGLRSTKPKTPSKLTTDTIPSSDTTTSHEMHIKIEQIRKLHTDDTGRFPVCSRSGIQYIMITYHFYSNVLIKDPLKSRSGKHRLLAYGAIMLLLK